MKPWMFLAPAALLILVAAPAPSAPAPADPPALSELAQARLKAAQEAYRRVMVTQEDDTKFDAEVQYVWSKRLLEAEREVARDNKEVAAAFQSHLDRMAGLETKTKKREEDQRRAGKANGYGPDQLARLTAAAFYRAEAELWLERAKPKK